MVFYVLAAQKRKSVKDAVFARGRKGGKLGSPGWDLDHRGRTRLARVGIALARVHHFKILEFLEKDKVTQLRRDNQRKGSATQQNKIPDNINYFLFDCVVSDISPLKVFKIKRSFSLTLAPMDINLWIKK